MESRHGKVRSALVLTGGTALAVSSGVFFYVKDDAKTGLSVIAALMVTLLTLQVQSILSEADRSAQRSRQEELIAVMEQVEWLLPVLHQLAKSASIIDRKYGNTAAVAAARRLIGACAADLSQLERGSLVSEVDDATILIAEAERTRKSIRSTSLQSVDLEWWSSGPGRKYWEANKRAISRGIHVERIFIYSEWSAVSALATEHAKAGVEVLRVRVDSLPKSLLNDFIIWDSFCAYRNGYDSRSGQTLNYFMLESSDIQRVESDYASIRSLASPIGLPENITHD